MFVVDARQFVADAEVRRKALEEYRRDGALIVRDVFEGGEVSEMQGTWTEIGEGRRQEGRDPHASLLMTHLSVPGVATVVRQPTLVRCVEEVLGGKVELIQTQVMFAPPGAKGFSPHQDNFFNRAEPKDDIVAAWIALEAVDKANGCLAVYPGSHVHGLVTTKRDWLYLLTKSFQIVRSILRKVLPGTGGSLNDSGVVERYAYAQTPKGVEPVEVAMAPGSVAFMHGDLIHFSFANTTRDRSRHSMVANFVRIGTRFTAGPLTHRLPFDVYAGAGEARPA